MRAALKSGYDPNKLDRASRPERSIGRPLYYATEYHVFDHSRRHENLPFVELLSEHGADPRMPGRASTSEDLRIAVKVSSLLQSWPSEEELEFFKMALNLMEKRVRELDSECFSSKRE